MPEAQLAEPLDHAAEKGGFKEVLATVEAAVKADVEALLGSGRVDTQDFETLERAVHRQALATAARVVKAAAEQQPHSRPRSRPKSTR